MNQFITNLADRIKGCLSGLDRAQYPTRGQHSERHHLYSHRRGALPLL